MLAVLLSSLAVAAPSALGGESADGPRVTMFGDSVAGSLDYVAEARQLLGEGIDLRLELSPCRKLVPIGCAHMGARPRSVLDIVKSSSLSELGNVVIVNVGYNDPANNYKTDMAQVMNALVERGVAHVIWVTLREKFDYYAEINNLIRTHASRWSGLRIADWEAASRGQDWFAPDGLHLNASGAMGLATLLRPYVLAACGSECDVAGPPATGIPRNVRPPTVRGTPVVGRDLTCRPGTWAGTKPLVLAYRWLRNDKVLARLHSQSRRLVPADRGREIACRVWAANARGAAQATSVAVRVRPAQP